MFAVALKYFAVILLILFHFNSRNSIFVCGEDGRQNASSLSRSTATTINGKRQSMIPLRETNDYDQKGGYSDDDDGDDEYDYDSYTESNSNDANENDVHRMANNDPTKSQSTESHRNFIFPMSADGSPNVKPKFLLSTLLPPTMPPIRSIIVDSTRTVHVRTVSTGMFMLEWFHGLFSFGIELVAARSTMDSATVSANWFFFSIFEWNCSSIIFLDFVFLSKFTASCRKICSMMRTVNKIFAIWAIWLIWN